MSQDTSIPSTEQRVSQFEKQIYNDFLITGKRLKNQPFKHRENFDKFEPEKYIEVKRLAIFFNRFKNIKSVDFFTAPYKVYGLDEYFDLKFYNSRKAIICYSTYMKDKELTDPDSDESMKELKDMLKFIYNYCKTEKINLLQYRTLMTSASIPVTLTHLKDHSINLLMLHALDVDQVIRKNDSDILDFYFPEFYTYYKQSRTNFIASTKFKQSARKGLEIIKNNLLISQ
jgi:hypothetical protein